MFIRVQWAKPNSDGHQMYHVYEAKEYFVEYLAWSGETPSKKDGKNEQPNQIRLMLDGSKHDILLSDGDLAYVMNENGKTIESIRT